MSGHPHLGEVDDMAGDWRWVSVPGDRVGDRRGGRAAGWIGFAGVIMIMIGAFNAIEGLAGLLAEEFYVVPPSDVLMFDLTGWGWVHTIVGVLVALTGAALLAGASWARVVTAVLLILNAAAQLAFVAVYPVWSLIVITLCVVVIWAVIVHGDEAGLDGG
jgi:hypothetical protein